MSDAPLNKLVAQINGHLERFEHAGPEDDEQRISVGLLLIARVTACNVASGTTGSRRTSNGQSVIVRRRLLWRMRPIRTENWQSNGKRTTIRAASSTKPTPTRREHYRPAAVGRGASCSSRAERHRFWPE